MAFYLHAAPGADHSAEHPGLYLHVNDEASGLLVVFVHGWGGSAYETWGELLAHVYSSPLRPDVASYFYKSGRHRRLGDGLDLEEIADQLAQELSQLTATYRRIVLIGHSMGGVLNAAVLRRSHESGKAMHRRTIGLVSLASPRFGISAVVFSVKCLPDTKFLKSLGEVHARNARFFDDLVDVETHIGSSREYHIPHYVCIAPQDRVVKSISASAGMPPARRHSIPGNHTTFLKHPEMSDWLGDCLAKFASIDKATRRISPQASSRTLLTAFRGHSRYRQWDSLYNETIRAFAEEENLLIRDAGVYAGEEGPLSLLVQVVPSDSVGAPHARAETRDSANMQEDGDVFALGIAAHGIDAEAKADLIHADLGTRPLRWIAGTEQDSALRREMLEWLKLTSSGIFAGRSVISDEDSEGGVANG